jgi:energy-coupling factor transporter ATP-binding protein EcfA2
MGFAPVVVLPTPVLTSIRLRLAKMILLLLPVGLRLSFRHNWTSDPMLKITYRQGVHIGEPAAEDDELLLTSCFVEMPALQQIADMSNSKCILLGRTGSGKSALLKHLEYFHQNTIRIDPKEFAFDYISNSNILRYVMDLGCDLHILFEYLWKHVLLCKAANCYFDNRSSLSKAIDQFVGNEAVRYLQTYQSKFWINQEVRMQEVSSAMESSINSELRGVLGQEVAKVEAGIGADLKLTNSQKKQIESRVSRAVSQLQIRDLQSAISHLDELVGSKQKEHYIIIDDLDSEWAENSIKYQMIRSLMETVKSFRKVRKIKVIIGLRSDVYEKSISSLQRDGYQPEKYEGMITKIRWEATDLKEVVERRINYVFKSAYFQKNIHIGNILPVKIRKIDVMDYLLNRTLLRPRDIIAFVNEILDHAAGATTIPEKTVSLAEGEYSKKRYDALIREWQSVHPHCVIYLRLLKSRTGSIAFEELSNKAVIDDFCVEIESLSDVTLPADEVEEQSRLYFKRQIDSRRDRLTSTIIATLYKMGAVEVKLAKGDHWRRCDVNEAVILPEQLSSDAALTVVPMLWRTLGITPNLG